MVSLISGNLNGWPVTAAKLLAARLATRIDACRAEVQLAEELPGSLWRFSWRRRLAQSCLAVRLSLVPEVELSAEVAKSWHLGLVRRFRPWVPQLGMCGGRGLEVSARPGGCLSSCRLSCQWRSRPRLAMKVAALPEGWAAGGGRGLPRRSSSPRSFSLPRRFLFAVGVHAGRPEVGVCFRRIFVGGREGPARRGA